jgi:ribose/xylose/arabinose/galactoside ABC-type transport system permease subunit
MRCNLLTILAGLILAIAAWVPLWIIEARDPTSMPVQLGLLAIAASIIGGVIAFVGLIRLVLLRIRS